jgi:hypothetical protein
MGPESETTVTPANLGMARANFEAARDRFALAYARGANMFSFIRDRVTGRPDEAITASVDLRANTLRLAEYEGRSSVISPTVNGFRAEVARGAAQSHAESQDDVVEAATEAVQTPGLWTAASRVWSGPEGDFIKLATTTVIAGAHLIGLGYGEGRDVIAHAAVFSGAITAMDLGRRAVLETTTRYAGALPGRIAELIRRKASLDEGAITGDIFPAYFEQPPADLVSGELEDRSEDALNQAFYANDIQRPPLIRNDAVWTGQLRTVITDTLNPFDQTQELIRSRDISVKSRLARTVLAVALAGGVAGHYFATRTTAPEVRGDNCPIISFPDPNLHAQQALNLPDVAHFSGIAKNMFFKRAYGVDFDHSPSHTELLNKLINEDPFGNNRIINAIAGRLRTANPQVVMVTPDAFKLKGPNGESVALVGICDPRELNSIYNGAIQNP